MHAVILEAVNRLFDDKDSIIPVLENNIKEALLGKTGDRLREINSELEELQSQLLESIGDEDEEERIGNLMIGLKDEHQELMTEAALREEVNERIREMTSYFRMMPQALTEYSDEIVRNLIEKIVVKPETILVVFKSGVEMEI